MEACIDCHPRGELDEAPSTVDVFNIFNRVKNLPEVLTVRALNALRGSLVASRTLA